MRVLAVFIFVCTSVIMAGCPFHSDPPQKCDEGQCEPNGYCVDDGGSPRCNCNEGYAEAVNENGAIDCEEANVVGQICGGTDGVCEQRARCYHNPPESFHSYCTVECNSDADCPEDEDGIQMECIEDASLSELVCTRVPTETDRFVR
jgi:hypothetical protein